MRSHELFVDVCREDATQRLLDVATIEENEWPGPLVRLKDWLTWRIIYAGNGEHSF